MRLILLPYFVAMSSGTRRSHIKKLNSCDIKINELTNSNIRLAFEKVRKLYPNLSDNYLISILTTVKKLNENVTVTPKYMKLHKKKRAIFGQTSPETMIGLTRVLKHTLRYLYYDMKSKRDIDTVIAILVAVCTDVGSNELLVMRQKHLFELKENKPCSLMVKRKYSNAPVRKVEPLFDKFIDFILAAIEYRVAVIGDDAQATAATKVIELRIDSVNKCINELYNQLNGKRPTESLGIQILRKLNKSTLVDIVEQVEQNELSDILDEAVDRIKPNKIENTASAAGDDEMQVEVEEYLDD